MRRRVRSQKWPELRLTQVESHFLIIAYERELIRLESSLRKILTFEGENIKLTSKNRSRCQVTKNFKNRKTEMAKMFLSSLPVESYEAILI